MIASSRVLCTLGFFVMLSGCATSDLVTRSVIKDLRTSITESGSAEAKDADQWVDLHIPYHHSLLAGVTQRPDGPIIVFTSGYQELLSNIAEVNVAVENRDPSLTLCLDRYTERLGKDWQRVLKESRGHPLLQNINPQWGTSPATYFENSPYKKCKPLAKDLPLAKQHHKLRDKIAAQSVKFIYLHEIGHIVMGKTPERLSRGSIAKMNNPQRLDALAERRQREYKADELAAKEYIRLHPDPMKMFDNSLFADSYRVYGAWNCFQEPKQTHPAGDRRTAKVMQYFLDNVVKANKPDASASVKQYMRKYIADTKSRVLLHKKCPKV